MTCRPARNWKRADRVLPGTTGHYKCPRTVDFVEALPRDPNGKLYKRLLKEKYWEGHDTRVL